MIEPTPNLPFNEIAVPRQVRPFGGIRTARDFVESGKRINVTSSWVRSIWYLKKRTMLYVIFVDGTLGYYHEVPERTAIDFFNAKSMGKFVHQRLKGHFPFVVIREGRGSNLRRSRRGRRR